MKALRKTEVNHFITKLNNDFENLAYFRPISLRPVELASLLEKLEGIYDSEHSRIDRELVAIGSSVTVLNLDDYCEYEFQITLPEDAAPPSGAISVLSPLGSKLIGHKKGEQVTLHLGNRANRFCIINVSNTSR